MSENSTYHSNNNSSDGHSDASNSHPQASSSEDQESTKSKQSKLDKYLNISNEGNNVKSLIESLPFQTNLFSDNPHHLSQDDRTNAAYRIFSDTIIRNLPDIDQNIAKILVNASIEEILPLIFKASEEIKHRYQDTGKFEGYEHPEIKEIIEKHLLSGHRSSQSLVTKIMRIFGTPIHEIFGKQKYAEGEPAIVAKNVHTVISRSGNIVAGSLFMEGMLAVTTSPFIAFTSSVILYTGLQTLNEYTNEVEHSTIDKRKKFTKYTKWATILIAKSIPIIMTALSVSAVETPSLHQRYMRLEGEKLYSELVKSAESAKDSPSNKKRLDDIKILKEEVKTLEDKLTEAENTKNSQSRNRLIRELEGKYKVNGKDVSDKNAARPRLEQRQKDIKKEMDKIENLKVQYDDDHFTLGVVGFYQKYADVPLGKDSIAGKDFKEKVQKYASLPSGTRFENGIGHMIEVLSQGKFNDEILLRVWVAMLFESLSIITLVAVQSRADFRKVVTNSDTQISLGQIVEGAVELNRQIASIADYNEFRSDEDKQLTDISNIKIKIHPSERFGMESEKSSKIESEKNSESVSDDSNLTKLTLNSWQKLVDHFISKPIDRIISDITNKEKNGKYRHEPPSYSSLVNSVAIQRAIAELFREGHVPAFNQIVGDISRGLIHPIPLDTEAIKRLEEAKKAKNKGRGTDGKDEMLVELFKHDEKLEGDTRYLVNIPRRMIRALQENILSNDKSSLSTEDLAINLSRILLNETPEKEVNYSLLLEELEKDKRKESYLKLLKTLQDLNSDIQDVIDNYGASKDRMDLKNSFKDKIRGAIKEFENGKELENNEKYANYNETILSDLVKSIEVKEANSNINYIRMDTAVSYIKELVAKDKITPVLLNQLIEGLKTGDAVIISTKEGNKELFQKIKELCLASPYETSIETCIYEMQKLATEYMMTKIRWIWKDKKLAEFKKQLAETITRYELESHNEKLKLKS